MGLFKGNKEQIQAQKADLSHSKVTSALKKLFPSKKHRSVRSSSHAQEESSENRSVNLDSGSRLPSSHGDPFATQSLWDRAYDTLKKKKPDLVEDYEELLKKTIPPSLDGPTQDEPPGGSTHRRLRQVQLDNLIGEGLQRVEEKSKKYTIAGHEFDLSNQIDHAASLMLWGKDLIGEAVKVSPEASIVWAGVCIILPLLTNPKVSNEAQQNGFDYVTIRMQYYCKTLEPLLREVSPTLTPEVSNHIIQLYERIIEFQIRSVLRFFKSSPKRYIGDVLQSEDWQKMVDDIKEFEGIVDRTLTQSNQLIARQELESLRNNSKDSLTKMQELLSVSKEQVRIGTDQLAISQRGLEIQEGEAKKKLSDEQDKCHQLFRLTDKNKDATYEWYKGRVEPRIDGTCEWFLNHENFKRWLEQDSGPLLVSADPGCGKSVLARYLIDHGLPRSTTICYFFFKDQDQNTGRQALCALLHQLFSLQPLLIEHAMKQFKKDGSGLIDSTSSLWTVLSNAVQDPQAGPIIIVLDALDECDESEFKDIMQNIYNQFRGHQSRSSKLKYLLTSRPYEQIVSKFRPLLDAFPYVRIPGEEESETISQEVNKVIKYLVGDLAKDKGLSNQLESHLAERLLGIPHRTYLWVYLVFDYLKDEIFIKTRKGVDSIIETLPKNIYQAYEKILGKCKKEQESTVKKALSIIIVARRPLTILEMNVALNVDNASKSIDDLNLEEEKDFKQRLRSWCGLFVSIHHGKVYFLHQTAREFLLDASSPTTISSGGHWQHSITSRDAHRALAEICVIYLDFLNHDDISTNESSQTNKGLDTFLDYSALHWSAHFHEAQFSEDADIIPYILRICDSDFRSCSMWFKIYWGTTYYNPEQKPSTSLMILSYFGCEVVVGLLLKKGADPKSKNEGGYLDTPLWWAALGGHVKVVKLLLEKGADPDSKDKEWGRTLLSWLGLQGDVEVIKLLLEKGADPNSKDNHDRTPLWWAASGGHVEVVKLLLKNGADLESKDINGRTPLQQAAENERTEAVKLLLEQGAKCEFEVAELQRFQELWGQRAKIAKMLLENGANLEKH